MSSDLERMLKGYGLLLAKLYYGMPDYPHVLNVFTWQEYDVAPDYPRLFKFVEFWQKEIDGPLHSISFDFRTELSCGKLRNIKGEFIIGNK